MGTKQSGFSFKGFITIVIVLGILLGVSTPLISGLLSESHQTKVSRLAGSIETGSSRNHSVDIAVEEGLTTTATDPFINISNCQDGQFFLISGRLPEGYQIVQTEVGDQVAVTCTLLGKDGKQADFVIIGAAGGVNRS